MDFTTWDILNLSSSILIPVFAVWYKIDSDKKTAENEAMNEKNKSEIMANITKTRQDLSETIGNIYAQVVENREINKRQDSQIDRAIGEIEILRKKHENGNK